MAIVLSSTTISVLRQSDTVDAYDRQADAGYAVIVSGIRATILPRKSARHLPEGASVSETVSMQADPILDLKESDRILDESTGEIYEIETAVTNIGMLIPLTNATLVKIARVH